MERVAKYLVAQHISDVIRNEPRNIGVFVSIGEERTARFIGDDGTGKIDGHKTRAFRYPEVYKQWVGHWWNILSREKFDLNAVINSSKENYQVIEGGEVANVGNDSVHDVANYLFAALVSDGNLALALGGEDEDITAEPLFNDVSESLTEHSILADDPSLQIPHPVKRNVQVKGTTNNPHRPSFVQDNGQLVVIDTVNLSSPKQSLVRDRAGFLAYMFKDIKHAKPGAKAVSVVRLNTEDEKFEKIAYALELLNSTSEVVNWNSDRERNGFIEQRIATAMSK